MGRAEASDQSSSKTPFIRPTKEVRWDVFLKAQLLFLEVLKESLPMHILNLSAPCYLCYHILAVILYSRISSQREGQRASTENTS